MNPGRGKISASTCPVPHPYSYFYNSVVRYIRKFEKYTPNPRYKDVDPLPRGANGPVEVGYNAHMWKGSEAFIQASINVGIPFSPDFCTSKGTMGTNKVRVSSHFLLTS